MSDTHCPAPHLGEQDAAARRGLLLAGRTVEQIAETFRVLGDPTRVRILDALAEGSLCVCDIAALVNISESAVSHQLRLLRAMRLVQPRRAGRQVFYSLDDQHIVHLMRLAVTHVQEQAPDTPSAVAARPASAAVVVSAERAPAPRLPARHASR